MSRRSDLWHTERLAKASLASAPPESGGRWRAPLSDELLDDNDSERPGAYSITRDDGDILGQGGDGQWDPTEPRQDSSSSGRQVMDLEDESDRRSSLQDEESEIENDDDDNATNKQHLAGLDTNWRRRRNIFIERRWLIAFGVLVVIAVIVVVAVFVFLAKTGSNAEPNVYSSDDDVCSFDLMVTQPDPFLQCTCDNTITVIHSNVRGHYETLKNLLKDHVSGISSIHSCDDPANVAMLWIASEIESNIQRGIFLSQDRYVQRLVLVTLYASTDGPNWTRKANWLTDNRECVWWGVDCDEDQGDLIVSLSLGANRLAGKLDSRIGLLNELRTLQLDANELTGSIPLELWRLSVLENVSMRDNTLMGRLPENLTQYSTSLQTIILSNNALTGSFPNLAGMARLQTLDLSKTMLVGPLPNITGLTGLREIDLSETTVQGNLHDWIDAMGMDPQLEVLKMERTQNLTGTLPVSLANLKILRIQVTSISGTVSDFLNSSIALEEFTVTDTDLSGTIPETLGQLTSLERFRFDFTSIFGSIPSSIASCTSLKSIFAGETHLFGPLPTDSFRQLSNLSTLSFYKVSALSGTLPIQDMPQLESLNILETGIELLLSNNNSDDTIILSDFCARETSPEIYVSAYECPCCKEKLFG